MPSAMYVWAHHHLELSPEDGQLFRNLKAGKYQLGQAMQLLRKRGKVDKGHSD
jgi:hypothetical protein